MDIGNMPEIAGSVTISAASIWILARQLISFYFKQKIDTETKIKVLESKLNEANDKLVESNFKNIIAHLEKDINALGAKIREFESKIDNRIRELIRMETTKGNI